MDFFEILKDWIPTLTSVLGSIGAVLACIKKFGKQVNLDEIKSDSKSVKIKLRRQEDKIDELTKIVKKMERRQRGVIDEDVRKN